MSSDTLRRNSRPQKSTHSNSSLAWKPWAFTALLLSLFGLVVFQLFGDRLRPAVPVTVTRALLLPATGETEPPAKTAEAGMLFQSSGWVEADPWPIRITALTDGVVEEVFFQSGDEVSAGQLLARLIPEDLELDLQRLQAEKQVAQLDVATTEQSLNVQKRAREAAESRLTKTQAASLAARDHWERTRQLREQDVVTEADEVEAEQTLRQREAEEQEAASQLELAAAQLEETRARLKTLAARVEAVDAERAILLLHQKRLEIRAPRDGRIQKRFAEPGLKRMQSMDEPESSTIAWLYDPAHLQVRVDVPLAEAGSLQVGQAARISSTLLPGQTFSGRVTRIVGEADLVRNTLQAKVAIEAPDPRLRPDTLCRVAFYPAPTSDDSSTVSRQTEAVWIPADLVNSADDQTDVWGVDPLTLTARRRTLRLHAEVRDGYRRVREGVTPNELLVIRSGRPLREGDRVSIESTP